MGLEASGTENAFSLPLLSLADVTYSTTCFGLLHSCFLPLLRWMQPTQARPLHSQNTTTMLASAIRSAARPLASRVTKAGKSIKIINVARF